MSNAIAHFQLLQRKPRRTDLELTDFGVLGLTWAPETLRANARDRLISRMYLDMGRVPTTLEEQRVVRAAAESQIDLIIEQGREYRAATGTTPVLPESMAIYAGGKVSPLDVPHVNARVAAADVAMSPREPCGPPSLRPTDEGAVALGTEVAPATAPKLPAVGKPPAPILHVTRPAIGDEVLGEHAPGPPEGLPPEDPASRTSGPAIPFERIWWGRWSIALALLVAGMLF